VLDIWAPIFEYNVGSSHEAVENFNSFGSF